MKDCLRKVNKGYATSAPTKPNQAKTTKITEIDSARAKRDSRFAGRTLGPSPLLPSPPYTNVDGNSTPGDWLEKFRSEERRVGKECPV